MILKKKPEEIWREYEKGIDYKTGLNLYDIVERNNNFFMDRQWEGINAPSLDKPVFNILKPVVNYYTAMLISDDIAINTEMADAAGASDTMELKSGNKRKVFQMEDVLPKVIASEVERVMEQTNARTLNRRMLRNCAVDGDACFYLWYDAREDGIRIDLLDNTNVYFGNPACAEVERQPYIILAYRMNTQEVREEAEGNGLPVEGILPDGETIYFNPGKEEERSCTTVLLKLWKEQGAVRYIKCTGKALVKQETDAGYERYPLAWMSWERVKNSYHGTSPLTGKIANQIFINKVYALSMRFVMLNAYPKVIYNEEKLPEGWNNDVGAAVKVLGDPNSAIFGGYQPPNMSGDAMRMVQSTMQQTKDLMGASDAALGNVKPDNTSAIIAVQRAAGVPLDLQRMDFHSFVEDYVRVILDMMRVHYGVRRICVRMNAGEKYAGDFDFSRLGESEFSLKIDIGAGTYWSQQMQVQMLDNLMKNKILSDPAVYLEMVPDEFVKDKHKILDSINGRRETGEQTTGRQKAARDARQGGSRPAPRGKRGQNV
ncbi:MAG TPA: hypothetical protein DEB31_00895 [Clostridiales bacterium]|nr:hypothetical protein [Clostridiales bacterium]